MHQFKQTRKKMYFMFITFNLGHNTNIRLSLNEVDEICELLYNL